MFGLNIMNADKIVHVPSESVLYVEYEPMHDGRTRIIVTTPDGAKHITHEDNLTAQKSIDALKLGFQLPWLNK